jgi:hypothetical protein
MKFQSATTFALALSAASLAVTTANAACPVAAAVFVIDESNTMNDPGASTGGTTPKRDIALTLAKNYLAEIPTGSPVAVVGFGNNPQYDPGYQHVIADFSAGYKAGSNNTQITAAFQQAHDETIPGSYWTPLAASVCEEIDNLLFTAVDPTCVIPGATPQTKLQVYLLSDGIENSTPPGNECEGTVTNTGTFTASLEGSGFGLTPQSWEWKMANKALTGDPQTTTIPPGGFKIVFNVALLFSYTNSLGGTSGVDGQGGVATSLQDTIPPAYATYMGGLSSVSYGSYFESKMNGSTPTKIPLAGDTDPSPTRSCVDAADINRVLSAMGHQVAPNDPTFSLQDLMMRDVNNDLVIDARDYQLVVKNYGKCS